MQLHMFWALYIHAADAQDVTGRPEKQAEVWDDLRNLRQLFWEFPHEKGTLALRHVPALDRDARELHDPRRLRRVVGEEGERLHALLARARRHPGHDVDGLVRRLPPRRHRVLQRDGGEELGAAAAARRAVEPRRDARRRRPTRSTSTSAPTRAGGCSATSRSSSTTSTAGSRGRAARRAGWAPNGKPVRIFVMGGGSGRKTPLGKLDHGGRWRDEDEWPLARARPMTLHLHGDGSLGTEPPSPLGRAAELHLRPRRPGADDRRPLLRRRRVPAGGHRHRADVGAAPQPGAPAAEHHDAGARGPEGVGGVLHGPGAVPAALGAPGRPRLPDRAARRGDRGDRADQGRALDRLERGRHRLHGEARRRVPAERGLPGGVRHAPQRLDHPHPLPRGLRPRGDDGARDALQGARSELPPTSNLFARRAPDPDRHLLVELPPPRAQPEHRRADRAAHAHGRSPSRRCSPTPSIPPGWCCR